MSPEKIIQKLNLKPLQVEGGFFRQSYKSNETFKLTSGETRSLATMIFYLITEKDFSSLHAVQSTEIFHFYAGDSVEFVTVENGNLEKTILGSDFMNGEHLQKAVPPQVWQGLRIKKPTLGWALLGTNVFPGFEYEDFKLVDRTQVITEVPQLLSELEVYLNSN